MEISKEILEAFFQWLKDDGLPPKKSERLWRKTILAKLLNEDKMTIANFEDFKRDYIKNLEIKRSNLVPKIDTKIIIGISLKYGDTIKVVQNAIEADSYMHLFFTDGSDELLHKTVCNDLLKSKSHTS